jgi:hypothetical protein
MKIVPLKGIGKIKFLSYIKITKKKVMSKLKQTKIPVSIDSKGNVYMDQLEAMLPKPEKPNWKLVRERDGLTKQSVDVIWIEWDETGKFKARHDNPDIGRSLLMSPFNQFFAWQTTAVTSIVEQREDYICFDTENSRYELFKIK